MKSLFETEAYIEILERLDKLDPDAERQWGKMSPAQMLHHCQAPLHILLQSKDYNLKPNWIAKTFFKKAMYSDRPWRKNLPTMSAFREKEKRNFEEEKKELTSLLKDLDTERSRSSWSPHPVFGHLTKEQWGKMQYKHLDHHLRQFNC
ncbi:MAG: DUF1569 domain-containing protein [Flavobacteriaceae bacterium]|nr:DUF1569 domain-containing protein [Flavobacteriaceae bacterium]